MVQFCTYIYVTPCICLLSHSSVTLFFITGVRACHVRMRPYMWLVLVQGSDLITSSILGPPSNVQRALGNKGWTVNDAMAINWRGWSIVNLIHIFLIKIIISNTRPSTIAELLVINS